MALVPLVNKLGIKSGNKILLIDPPPNYKKWISPLPDDVTFLKQASINTVDFVHLFACDVKSFESGFLLGKSAINKKGMVWVSWPKKSSGVVTDLTENIIREFGLSTGLVDVKICAVNETWSGLKFVYRLKDRV